MGEVTEKEKTKFWKDWSKKKKVLLLVSLIVLVIAGVVLSFFQIVRGYVKKSDYQPDSTEIVMDSEALETLETETDSEINAELEEHINIMSEEEMERSADVINILLIGADTRDGSYGNSDTMIIMSIKEKEKEIYMTSLMRDTYVTIPNVGNTKLNNAYAVGGPQLLVDTVEMNFHVDIDYYISVDFSNFMSIVDSVGGIEMGVTADEIAVMNVEYIAELNYLAGEPLGTDYLPEGQDYNGVLNGKQALAYCRVRYVGNADYQRTERQRNVIMAILQKAKTMGLSQAVDLAETLLPMMKHNIPESQFMVFLSKVFYYFDYNIVSDRLPYDGLYTDVNSFLAISDWAQTVAILRERIYGNQTEAAEDTVSAEDGVVDAPLEDETAETAAVPVEGGTVAVPVEGETMPAENEADGVVVQESNGDLSVLQ